jgi:hypothetical protein
MLGIRLLRYVLVFTANSVFCALKCFFFHVYILVKDVTYEFLVEKRLLPTSYRTMSKLHFIWNIIEYLPYHTAQHFRRQPFYEFLVFRKPAYNKQWLCKATACNACSWLGWTCRLSWRWKLSVYSTEYVSSAISGSQCDARYALCRQRCQ